MSLKPLWVFMAVFFILGSLCLYGLLSWNPSDEPDILAYNDIARSLGETWASMGGGSLPGLQYRLDYAVTDLDGNLLAATKPGLDATVSAAVAHGDAMLDIVSYGVVVGNVIFANPSVADLAWKRHSLLIAGLFLLLVPLLFCAGFAYYLYQRVISPFRRLDGFARRVAAGDLDVPLEMDRRNLFGPFTESFDLMRSELAHARHNEYLANQSKKELVASLSHDIKTPVASIQAIAELMLVCEPDVEARRRLETIGEKARQITSLVTDLFHASLEELQILKVTPAEESSAVLTGLIRAADYAGRADVPDAPPCLLLFDRLRLSQVLDNIFGNSYKYAGTSIEVRYSFAGEYLCVAISDAGPGAPEGSLPLLCNKYYRGENARGVGGSGLGLYLARRFAEQMGGGLTVENRVEGGITRGFTVMVELPLAGRDGVSAL